MIDLVIEYIRRNYDPRDGATVYVSGQIGGEDAFQDGMRLGICLVLFDIAEMLGLELPKPWGSN